MRKNRETHMQPLIGQAWTGKHVVLMHCTENNHFLNLYKSFHAPIEPPRQNCAETLSQLLSIGYHIESVTSLSPGKVQYFLVLE